MNDTLMVRNGCLGKVRSTSAYEKKKNENFLDFSTFRKGVWRELTFRNILLVVLLVSNEEG